MKNPLKFLIPLFCLIFIISSCDNYTPVDEIGVSFMPLTIKLSDEIAVPNGSITVKYGASRHDFTEVSAAITQDGKSATASLDEYYASSTGKIRLSFTVKKSGEETALAISSDKSSISFDEDGATVNLSAKTSSTESGTTKTETSETTESENTGTSGTTTTSGTETTETAGNSETGTTGNGTSGTEATESGSASGTEGTGSATE